MGIPKTRNAHLGQGELDLVADVFRGDDGRTHPMDWVRSEYVDDRAAILLTLRNGERMRFDWVSPQSVPAARPGAAP